MKTLENTVRSINPISSDYIERASSRLDTLIKPIGSLGRLEEFAKCFVAIQENIKPTLRKKAVFVLASDHGVTEERVSAYPKEVTRQMVYNFLGGGAAINVLSRHVGAQVFVVDTGVDWEFEDAEGLIIKKIGWGTRNFLKETAMTREQAVQSIETGIEMAEEAVGRGYDLFALGDMGIGNTTSAAAVVCSILNLEPKKTVGHGTGISEETRQRKIRVVEDALALNTPDPQSPLDVLSKVGGFEIGGITGLILGAASKRVPVVVDGFATTAGACLALGISPKAKDYIFFSHRSAEKGHGLVLEKLGVKPILDLDLRLGEGTGAVLAMSLIEAAVKTYNEMATFDETGISKE